MNLLLFALGQPAVAVIQGHNILRFQVAISFCAAMIALIGAYYLAPLVGVRGAAASLLAGEFFVTASSLLLSRRIFGMINVSWPKKQILITVVAVAFSVLLIVVA